MERAQMLSERRAFRDVDSTFNAHAERIEERSEKKDDLQFEAAPRRRDNA